LLAVLVLTVISLLVFLLVCAFAFALSLVGVVPHSLLLVQLLVDTAYSTSEFRVQRE